MLARGLLTCDAHQLDRHSLNKDSTLTASCKVGSFLGEQTRAKRLEKEEELPSGVTGGNDMVGEQEFSRWIRAGEILRDLQKSRGGWNKQ